MEINFKNQQNFPPKNVTSTLKSDQKPLGTQFPSYQLNSAINYYLLDPFQYSITKFDYYLPDGKPTNTTEMSVDSKDFKNDPGLIYRQVDFDTLLPTFTAVKKSVNDFPAQDYHRFMANEGYFNPKEGKDNSDLWYYGAQRPDNIQGAPLNVQEVNHIIFPEAQRGGTDTKNLAKYSWTSQLPKRDTTSWESNNYKPVDNNQNCQFFNYNNGYNKVDKSVNKVYQFDSNYTRSIGISSPDSGSMPFL
jgi:hypothetical protein